MSNIFTIITLHCSFLFQAEFILLFSPVAGFTKSELDFIQLEAHLCLDVALAANYLDVPRLLDLACHAIANSIKGKTGQEMMETFGLVTQHRPETRDEESDSSEPSKRYEYINDFFQLVPGSRYPDIFSG